MREDLERLEHGVPAVAVSDRSTRANRTGSWKYIRPIYQDKVAPCGHACPAGMDIEATMRLVSEGKSDEATDLVLRENPFPAVTGRVCDRPCETACNRASFDEAVSIRAVERMLGATLFERPLPAPAPRTRKETVGIVGAGPAGLSAAYHLARLGYGVTVYEVAEEPGGRMRYGFSAHRLPRDVVQREIARIAALGVEIRCGIRVDDDLERAALETHDAVLMAADSTRAHALAVEGAHLGGVRPGREFLAELARGLKPVVGSRVVVLGGDSTAIECACAALRLGAHVTVVHEGRRESLTAAMDEVQEAVCEGIRFEPYAAATALLAAPPRDDAALDGVESSFDERGAGMGPPRVAAVRCVRLAVDSAGGRLALPEGAFLLEADVVLFGDEMADREDRSVAEAIGHGKHAAIDIDRRLRTAAGETGLPDPAKQTLGEGGPASMTRWRGDDPVCRVEPSDELVTFEKLNTAQFLHARRHRERYMSSDWTRRTFAEANLGLTREEAQAEAGRCLHCGVCDHCDVCMIFCPDAAITKTSDGRYQLSYKYCKGCGVCVAECPRCAMTMTREGL
jgi:NADPH-dependent glutamate synthase beta subunit-like oxidoreductase